VYRTYRLFRFRRIPFTAYERVGAFDRAVATFESMKPWVELGPEAVSRMSFKELVMLTGTTDLSGFSVSYTGLIHLGRIFEQELWYTAC
jgi:hypothetical protein